VLHRPIETTAQSGHPDSTQQCLLSGVKRTSTNAHPMSAPDKFLAMIIRFNAKSYGVHLAMISRL
jgi:hypothetical protein